MLKFGQEYVERGIDYYNKLYKEKALKNLGKRARELGYILVKKDELVEGVSQKSIKKMKNIEKFSI